MQSTDWAALEENLMMIPIWMLVTDYRTIRAATVHGSFTEAVAALRDNFDPTGELEEIPDEDLAEVMTALGIVHATIETETVDVPGYALPTQCPVSQDAVEDALAESDLDDAVLTRIEDVVDTKMWLAALEAAFAPHQQAWEAILEATVADTIAILADMAAEDDETDGPD